MPLTDQQRSAALEQFKHFDADGSGEIDEKELEQILDLLKMDTTPAAIKSLFEEADTDKSGQISPAEFLAIVEQIVDGGGGGGFAAVVQAHAKLISVKGFSGVHSYSQEEMSAFANHMNNTLGNDDDLKHVMPIGTDGIELAEAVKDGILLAKFINLAEPNTIDERAINKVKGGKDLSLFKINENLSLDIAAAKSIGVQVTNVGPAELRDGAKFPHLVLGIIWQLVRLQLLNSINLKNHPELVRLLEDGEELADLLRLPPEQLLLRWFNYHLKNAGWEKRVHNFGPDIADGTAYTVLLSQIAPESCDRTPLNAANNTDRANAVLTNSRKIGVNPILSAKDITKGNARLNLAFTAALFNQRPALEELSQEELEKAGLDDDDFGDSREERAFRMWINSMGVDGLYVNNLFEDCRDGLVLLKVEDAIEPGSVNWKKVSKKPKNKFSKVGNCNIAVDVAKDKQGRFGLSLVGIGGTDVYDGNKKLILAIVWQLMRHHTIKYIHEVSEKAFGSGKEVTEKDIVAWANDKVKSTGSSRTMSSFKDQSLNNSFFFFDLLKAIEPRVLDPELITDGETEEDRMLNARYALSVARKLGAVIFLLPEDILEVKPKMILTFTASLMSIALSMK